MSCSFHVPHLALRDLLPFTPSSFFQLDHQAGKLYMSCRNHHRMLKAIPEPTRVVKNNKRRAVYECRCTYRYRSFKPPNPLGPVSDNGTVQSHYFPNSTHSRLYNQLKNPSSYYSHSQSPSQHHQPHLSARKSSFVIYHSVAHASFR